MRPDKASGVTSIQTVRERRRLTVNGIVQGVGFRPFVYRLAHNLKLGGSVANDSLGAVVEIEGPPQNLDRFVAELHAQKPPLARIDSCSVEAIPTRHEKTFSVAKSDARLTSETAICPDVAVCDDCLSEMNDPADRRFAYPFINCTNCGPRYTIIDSIPYDRPGTSMAAFEMCPECEREYTDPTNRRFHAQPVACPNCGPSVWLSDGAAVLASDNPVVDAAQAVLAGKIVALRGLGGFHLAVDATNNNAVERLRFRKGRAEKPLALMAPDISMIQRYCEVSPHERELLNHYRSPIVLLKRRESFQEVAHSVAPDSSTLGFMLAYTPLHHLLLRQIERPLVMTSGNCSEEPIAIANHDALERLSDIADLFLLHDREILQRCDDSIVRYSAGAPRVIRRARGYVPEAIQVASVFTHPILACGAELKNTIALARGQEVFLSQHVGDLDNPRALEYFQECVDHLSDVLQIHPSIIACDLHPEYLSTKWAKEQSGISLMPVQHHHAHLAAVMAEHKRSELTIGITLDGTGYGLDGTIWGGEVLVGDFAGFKRFAWLKPLPLIGGSAAIREPWRMALAYLRYAGAEESVIAQFVSGQGKSVAEIQTLWEIAERGINSPLTSSCGRLFEGAAALLGIRSVNSYEAQAAIMIEQVAGLKPLSRSELYERTDAPSAGALQFDWLIKEALRDLQNEVEIMIIARRFHVSVAELFIDAALCARARHGVNSVGLSGGVFQNNLLFEYMCARLVDEGFDTLTHQDTPTNDGCIALGQAVIANACSENR